MKIKLALIGLLSISGFVCFLLYNLAGNAQTSPTTIFGKFYRFDVVTLQPPGNYLT